MDPKTPLLLRILLSGRKEKVKGKCFSDDDDDDDLPLDCL